MENQETGTSSRISAWSAGVVTETGPNRATWDTSIIGTSTFSSSASTINRSPLLRSRAPGF